MDDNSELEQNFLNWTIQELNCSNLNMKSIHWAAFMDNDDNINNTDLNILDLSKNNISVIPIKTFDMLKKLEFLYLNHNILTSIDKSYFCGLFFLKSLILHNNKINAIDENTFLHLTNLKKLNIEYNNITNISKPIFRGLDNLEVLELRSNRIAILHAQNFIYLVSLKRLDMGYNEIKILSNAYFSQLKELVMLKLDHNKIELIENNDETLNSLQTLYINNNIIKSIDNYIFLEFEKFPKLKFIDISYNNISMIKEVNFTFPAYVNDIILSNNLLNCLCELAMKGDAYISKHLDISEKNVILIRKRLLMFLNVKYF